MPPRKSTQSPTLPEIFSTSLVRLIPSLQSPQLSKATTDSNKKNQLNAIRAACGGAALIFLPKHLELTKILRNFATEFKRLLNMEPKIGDKMKVSPQLTDQADWIDGEVIDVEHNPFTGLVISIKDKLGRIFFGQSRFFIAL